MCTSKNSHIFVNQRIDCVQQVGNHYDRRLLSKLSWAQIVSYKNDKAQLLKGKVNGYSI